MDAMADDGTLDLAIVGGGIAGLYLAWRLTTSQDCFRRTGIRPNRICIYEATGRVGGRLLSVPMPGMGIPAELGGMRFTPSQLLFRRMANLCVSDLADRDDFADREVAVTDFDYPTLHMYLRGRHLKFGESSSARCEMCDGDLPYKFQAGEVANAMLLVKQALSDTLRSLVLPPGSALSRSIDRKRCRLAENGADLKRSTFSAEEWEYMKQNCPLRAQGGVRPLYELGFWNLLYHYLSNEAFLFLRDALGYESVFVNWNAAEAVTWFLGDFDTKYQTITSGMDSVPQWLASELEGSVPIQTNCALRRVEAADGGAERTGTMVLAFDQLDTKGETLETVRRRAKRVVLALPKGALERLTYQFGPGRSEQEVMLRGLLDTVTAHPLFKLFLAYETPWWSQSDGLEAVAGRATTDLPIRQVYYFGQGPGRKVENDRPALVMASYSDGQYVGYWSPVEKVVGTTPYFRGECESLPPDQRTVLASRGISKRMILKAHAQVAELHPQLRGANRIPEPYVGVVQNWGAEPFYGGWHSWDVRTEPWDILARLTKPVDDLDLYICGEAYSREQGWAEGALKSAELVLSDLGLNEPGGIAQRDYDRRAGCKDYEEYIRT